MSRSSLGNQTLVVIVNPAALTDYACDEPAVFCAIMILAGNLKCPFSIARKTYAQRALQRTVMQVSSKNPHSYKADVVDAGCIMHTVPEALCENKLYVTDPRKDDLIIYHMMLKGLV